MGQSGNTQLVRTRQISNSEAEHYYPLEFIKKYRLSKKDGVYIPSDWQPAKHPGANIYRGASIAYSKAALTAERIIRSIDEYMVSVIDYPVKPSYSVRAGQPVFKWGTGRHMVVVPREKWEMAFAQFYKLPYVAMCLIRHKPSTDTYSAMVFFKDDAVFKD